MSVTATPPRLRRDARTQQRPRRSGWRRAWSIVTTVVLAVVALFAILAIGVPFVLGAQSYTVLTGSMKPGMPPGSLVAAKPTDFASIRVGDVITYQLEPGEPAVVTHRVVGTTEDNNGDRMLITQGDANDVVDEKPVISAQVRGVIVYAVPLVGYPNSLIPGSTRSAAVVMIGVAVVGYGVAVLLSDLVRSRRRPSAARGRRGPTRGAAALVAVFLCAGAIGSMAAAPSAHAAEATPLAQAPSKWLQLSTDGQTWVSGGALMLFDGVAGLTPGGSVIETLWVRNAGPDAATASVAVEFRPESTDPADVALARSLTLSVDGAAVPPGGDTSLAPLAPASERRFELRLALDPDSGNASRDAVARVAPVIRLTQNLDDAGSPSPFPPLAATGMDLALPALLASGGLAIIVVGAVLLRRSRADDR